MKRTGAGTLTTDHVGQRVRLEAWVQRRRDLGGLMFLDLRDRSGLAQAVVHPDEVAAVSETLAPVRAEWVVAVEGTVLARENPNPEMATGAVEVRVEAAQVLNRAEPLPIDLSGRTEASEDHRLRYRYLELRRPELQKNFLLRAALIRETLNYFHEHGFAYLETPILTRSTPEGARDYLVPSRVHHGEFYALPQSPQLFKQLFMVAGFERYLQIARCFRDEDLRADRQPEFTQIDLEMSFVEPAEIRELIEGFYARAFALVGAEVATPFPRMSYREAMARYGSDKPDLRFGVPIVDLTAAVATSAFRGFAETVAKGGVVRGIALPGGSGAAEASRKQVDGWAESARKRGAAGVLTLRRRAGELQFQVKGALKEVELATVAEALELEEGGLALLVAADEATAGAALGALRLELAEQFGLVPAGAHAFLWVEEFPLLEREGDSGRWAAVHHPFTSPEPEDLPLLDVDPGKVRSRAYDVVYNGLELGGGSIRIHRPELQLKILGLLGLDEAEARRRFGFLLEALSFGAPPHGGIALGLDRLVMVLAGASSLREVITVPKTTSATCLMTEAPSPVDAAQLRELGIGILPGGARG